MKKAWKIYGWAWVAFVAACIVTIAVATIRPSHHELAKDPYSIEKIVKVDLPEIVRVESDDNLDRGSSRWDEFCHHGQFAENVSEESIKAMEKLCLTNSLHWSKDTNKGFYIYSDQTRKDLYSVYCTISPDHFYMIYEIDEDEGLFVILPFFLVNIALLGWGIILVIFSIIRRIVNHFRLKAAR